MALFIIQWVLVVVVACLGVMSVLLTVLLVGIVWKELRK